MRYLIVISCFLFCSCSTVQSIISEPLQRPALDLPAIDPLSLRDVKFKVVHKDNSEVSFQKMVDNNEQPVLFCLSGDDYKALASNIADVQSFMRLQNRLLELYKQYYEPKPVE
jgi:hypothetical protein